MKDQEPFDYLAAIEEMQAEERKLHQSRETEFIPEVKNAAVDYTAAAKAWDRALRGRDRVSMPAGKGKRA